MPNSYNLNGPRAKRYRLMMEAGRDDAYIARRMGVDEATVGHWRTRLKIPRPAPLRSRMFEERRDRYRALFEKGLDNDEVAKRLGVKRPAVSRMRRKLVGPVPSLEEEHGLDLEHIAREYNRTGKVKPLVEFYNVSWSTISTAIKHAREQGMVTREPFQSRPYTEDELKRARYLLEEEGLSYAMTAHELGRTDAHALSRHLPGMGWTPQQRLEYRWMRERLDNL